MKGFYDTRSRIVHGGDLKRKHIQHLEMFEELLSIVRHLLRAFVRFGVCRVEGYSESYFNEKLDAALVHTGERERLRAALGFD
jgi:hypothetical protein